MSDESICGRCGLPIHRDSPMQYFGTFVAHEPNECVRLLQRLRAENERLRRDAERLDYIEGLDHIERYYEHGPDMSGNHVWFPTPHHLRFRGLTFRAAVDAARAAGGEK